ncbi:unnamed protein product [Nezara viridula]|uniref:Atg6 BARA domain-containing protein n=1 Tax=Nezara viridula TaxID=85310 RepID=A0A9P0H650_NEZVI|nr:unnamed protein product [Nezara viridula]
MAGPSNEQFQAAKEDGFVYVERPPDPNKLLKQFEALHCELEMEYEVLSVEELFEDGEAEEKKNQKRLDQIEGKYWSDHAKNIIKNTDDGGKYIILKELLDYGLGRIKTCDTNMKIAKGFIIVETIDVCMINYKRLGYTPGDEVSSTEINLALVEATALLCVLSDKLEVRFKDYFPVPHDINSFIIILSDQRILPLYCKCDLSHFRSKEFDDALVAFLDCMSQLHDKMKIITPRPGKAKIPYEIENDKLKDPETGRLYTVRLLSTNTEQWSRAMGYLLRNLKAMVKWVAIHIHELEPFPDQ